MESSENNVIVYIPTWEEGGLVSDSMVIVGSVEAKVRAALALIEAKHPARKGAVEHILRNDRMGEKWYGMSTEGTITAEEAIAVYQRMIDAGFSPDSLAPFAKWRKGSERAQALLEDALRTADLPRVPMFQRERQWRDAGDEADADKINVGADRPWRETRKSRDARGSGNLTLLIDIGSNASCNASQWQWSSVASRWIIEHLLALRYRPSVAVLSRIEHTVNPASPSTNVRVRHPNRNPSAYTPGYTVIPMPSNAMPRSRMHYQYSGGRIMRSRDIESHATLCASVVSDGSAPNLAMLENIDLFAHPGFFRSVHFASFVGATPASVSYGLGRCEEMIPIGSIAAVHGDALRRPYAVLPRMNSAADAVFGIGSVLRVVLSQADAVMTEDESIGDDLMQYFRADLYNYEYKPARGFNVPKFPKQDRKRGQKGK